MAEPTQHPIELIPVAAQSSATDAQSPAISPTGSLPGHNVKLADVKKSKQIQNRNTVALKALKYFVLAVMVAAIVATVFFAAVVLSPLLTIVAALVACAAGIIFFHLVAADMDRDYYYSLLKDTAVDARAVHKITNDLLIMAPKNEDQKEIKECQEKNLDLLKKIYDRHLNISGVPTPKPKDTLNALAQKPKINELIEDYTSSPPDFTNWKTLSPHQKDYITVLSTHIMQPIKQKKLDTAEILELKSKVIKKIKEAIFNPISDRAAADKELAELKKEFEELKQEIEESSKHDKETCDDVV